MSYHSFSCSWGLGVMFWSLYLMSWEEGGAVDHNLIEKNIHMHCDYNNVKFWKPFKKFAQPWSKESFLLWICKVRPPLLAAKKQTHVTLRSTWKIIYLRTTGIQNILHLNQPTRTILKKKKKKKKKYCKWQRKKTLGKSQLSVVQLCWKKKKKIKETLSMF